MNCTHHVMGIPVTHHHWTPRVLGTETLESQGTNMWARPVYREYVRCDKQQVCSTCGAAGRTTSCFCDTLKAEQCEPRLAWLAQQRPQI
jgi:hypothetical protein